MIAPNPENKPRSLLDFALGYGARGWRVIPLHNICADGTCSCGKPDCGSPGKHPRTAHGLRDGTTNANTIRRWWNRWPEANIAVCTGPESGLWMLGPDGEQGLADLAALERQHGPLPRTPKAKSGSGGNHNLFRWPAEGTIGNQKRHRGTEIDIRGAGGYFVAAPSRNGNGPYEWEIGPDDCPLAEASAWLLEWCQQKEAKRSAFQQTASSSTSTIDRAIKYLAKMEPAISGQRGHDRTMEAARVVVYGFDLGIETGYQVLAQHYNPRCQPPWPERELRHKCEQADSKPFGKPRGWLLDQTPSTNGHHSKDSDGNKPRSEKAASAPEEPEPWEDPLPLGEVPEAEPFPLDVLPAPARNLVEEIAWAMNCAPDLAGVALLALASGAIANGRHLAITETHLVSPCLYAVVVAPPGSAKSPPLRLLRRPLDLAENQQRKEWKAALQQWKDSEKEERGPRPTLRRCVVSNITTESLQMTLDENPRGLLMIRNELSGLVAGLNQYKSGGDDRQFYLDLWDGTPIINDRKSDRSRDGAPVFVLDAFTSIYGTIQPDVIAVMRMDMSRRRAALNDGFLDRFLFSYPQDVPAVGEQWRSVSTGARAAWEDAIRELLSLKMREQSGHPPRPELLKLSAEARTAWKRFTDAMADEINQEDFPSHLRGPWMKLRAYGARLALVLRCLRWAYQQRGEIGDALEDVDAESMEGAAQLVSYFKSHARRVYAIIDADPRHREAKRVLRWLGNTLKCLKCLKGSHVVSKSELHAGVWGGSKDVEEVSDVISLLVRYGWLRPLLEEERKGPGRRGSPRFEIHPHVFRTPSDISGISGNCPREPGQEG